jgi:hypothetical protein
MRGSPKLTSASPPPAPTNAQRRTAIAESILILLVAGLPAAGASRNCDVWPQGSLTRALTRRLGVHPPSTDALWTGTATQLDNETQRQHRLVGRLLDGFLVTARGNATSLAPRSKGPKYSRILSELAARVHALAQEPREAETNLAVRGVAPTGLLRIAQEPTAATPASSDNLLKRTDAALVSFQAVARQLQRLPTNSRCAPAPPPSAAPPPPPVPSTHTAQAPPDSAPAQQQAPTIPCHHARTQLASGAAARRGWRGPQLAAPGSPMACAGGPGGAAAAAPGCAAPARGGQKARDRADARVQVRRDLAVVSRLALRWQTGDAECLCQAHTCTTTLRATRPRETSEGPFCPTGSRGAVRPVVALHAPGRQSKRRSGCTSTTAARPLLRCAAAPWRNATAAPPMTSPTAGTAWCDWGSRSRGRPARPEEPAHPRLAGPPAPTCSQPPSDQPLLRPAALRGPGRARAAAATRREHVVPAHDQAHGKLRG